METQTLRTQSCVSPCKNLDHDHSKPMTRDWDDGGDSETPDWSADADESGTTVHRNWEQSGQPSVTIVEAVATATDRLPTDLPPLQEYVDTDAVDTILTHESSVMVSFMYAGATISVSGHGAIKVGVDGSLADEDSK